MEVKNVKQSSVVRPRLDVAAGVCGALWWHVVWCGVVWCGVVGYGMVSTFLPRFHTLGRQCSPRSRRGSSAKLGVPWLHCVRSDRGVGCSGATMGTVHCSRYRRKMRTGSPPEDPSPRKASCKLVRRAAPPITCLQHQQYMYSLLLDLLELLELELAVAAVY